MNGLVQFFLATLGAVGMTVPVLGQEGVILSIPLVEYRQNQQIYGPLDRLFIKDDTVYYVSSTPSPGSSALAGFRYRLHDSGGSESANGIFHDHMETETELRRMASLHPNVASFFSIGASLEGRSITGIRISHLPENGRNPRIYILGCHHAREWISVEVPLDIARHLLESLGSDPEIDRILRETQIYIIPIVNPDGLEYSIYRYRYWRKNRRHNGDYIWGVDINRNYGYQWAFDDTGSSPDPSSSVYRGDSPFSEPETAALRDFMVLHPPAGVLSYHNYSQTILYPWGFTRIAAADEERMKNLAAEMSQSMEAVNGRKYSYGSASQMLYLTNGDCTDWVYGEFAALAFTVELPPPSDIGHFFNSEEEIVPICLENRSGAMTFISHFVNR